MTIDDQIRNENLKYDINREAAKILALSSSKIHKYKYLTGEEILSFNQKQIIERDKFNYSPLGKALEKQIKTIQDQGKKRVEALKCLKSKKHTKAIEDESNDQLTIQKEIYNRLLAERSDKIREIAKEIDYNKLIYCFKVRILPNKFYYIFKEIREGDKNLQEIIDYQKDVIKKC